MTINTLHAYAYLTASYNSGSGTPLAILDYVVSRSCRGIDSAFRIAQLQKQIENDWGLKIPANVIGYTISRLVGQKLVQVISAATPSSIYKSVISDVRWKEIRSIEQAALGRYQRLLGKISTVLHSESYLRGTTADEVLEGWLDSNALAFLGKTTKYSNPTVREIEINRLVAKVLGLIGERDEEAVNDLSEIALGDVLHRSLSEITEHELLESDRTRKKPMSEVTVFVDVHLLSKAIGYYGPEEQSATDELLTMARETGCTVKAFSHNVVELGDAIGAASNRIRLGGTDAYGPMVAYAMEEGVEPAVLFEKSMRVDQDVASLGVEIVDHPAIDVRHQPSEKDFQTMLANEMGTQNAIARNRDVDSLFSIYQLRDGKSVDHLESCKAIFVTGNRRLQSVAHKFFKRLFEEEGRSNVVQLCMHETVFAARLWTKLPTLRNWLPRKQVVAIALSNLTASNGLRQSFLAKLEELVKADKLDKESAYLISCSRFADRLLAQEYHSTDQLTTQDVNTVAVEALKDISSKLEKARREGFEKGVSQSLDEAAKVRAQIETLSDSRQALDKQIAELEQRGIHTLSAIRLARTISRKIAYILLYAIVLLIWMGYALNAFWNPLATEIGTWQSIVVLLSGLVLLLMSLAGLGLSGLREWIVSKASSLILRAMLD